MKFIMPRLIMNVEKWRWNKEYRIYVSNQGHFKDEHKRPLPVKINNGGYVTIQTPVGAKLAHRLVMLTFQFVPNAEDMTVDHLDHNKRNNSELNLEWVTIEENQKRASEDLLREEVKVSIENCYFYATNGKQVKYFNSYKHIFNSLKQKGYLKKNKEMTKEFENKMIRLIETHETAFGYVWYKGEKE